MTSNVQALREAISRWLSHNVGNYWVEVDYIGSALNRLGTHVLTQVDGRLWHQWHDDWREIEAGSDFWLLSVPGSFAWAREILETEKSLGTSETSPIQLRLNAEYGYVELLRVKMAQRDAANFTFEIKQFGVGTHPDFHK